MRLLADLGVTDVGENRHQEAEAKAAECADLALTWHFIGGLQSNKAAAVAAYADVVESVDRAKLVAPLARGAHAARRPGRRPAPGQPGPARAPRAAPARTPTTWPGSPRRVEESDGLRLRGLMAVAPLGEDPAAAFGRLAGDPRTTSSRSTPTPPGSRRG